MIRNKSRERWLRQAAQRAEHTASVLGGLSSPDVRTYLCEKKGAPDAASLQKEPGNSLDGELCTECVCGGPGM